MTQSKDLREFVEKKFNVYADPSEQIDQILDLISQRETAVLKQISDKWWELDTLPVEESWEKMKDYLERRLK